MKQKPLLEIPPEKRKELIQYLINHLDEQQLEEMDFNAMEEYTVDLT